VGIEALSRGAASVTFVEQGAPALVVLRKNLDNLGLRGATVQVEKRSAGRFLRGSVEKGAPGKFGVVFLDPPYDLADEYATTLGLLGGECAASLAPGALVIAEHRRKQGLAETFGRLTRVRLLEQGDAGLSFYSLEQAG
jgi:16S rRNA G966 N2-methylase RsmD